MLPPTLIPVQRPCVASEELEAISGVLESRWLGMGALTRQFEEQLAQFLGAPHVAAVSTGTSALQLALEALQLEEGDEVIVPSLTFIATIQAILAARLCPVFCDVSEDNLNMDIEDVSRRITARTRVLLPVHYGGWTCDMDALLALAEQHDFWVVEDAAHAFGSCYRGRKIGNLGDVTCFSFDPIKNITCGEGGAVVSSNAQIIERVKRMRLLGMSNDTWSRLKQERNWSYEVVSRGYRHHMSNLNAAIGMAQLKRAGEFQQKKQRIARCYDAAFGALDGVLLPQRKLDEIFPFFYVLRVLNGQRDPFMRFLRERGVATGVHYPPNHLQPLFRRHHARLPRTEMVAGELVTVPLFCEMTDEEVERVLHSVKEFFNRKRTEFPFAR